MATTQSFTLQQKTARVPCQSKSTLSLALPPAILAPSRSRSCLLFPSGRPSLSSGPPSPKVKPPWRSACPAKEPTLSTVSGSHHPAPATTAKDPAALRSAALLRLTAGSGRPRLGRCRIWPSTAFSCRFLSLSQSLSPSLTFSFSPCRFTPPEEER